VWQWLLPSESCIVASRRPDLPERPPAQIRRMGLEDVDAAAAAIREGGWGDRRASLEFFARQPSTVPLLAEVDGVTVGTAIAAQHGSCGWIGLVFVAPEMRGRGLGAELTRAALQVLQEHACLTVLLAATELGRPIYDRLGFVPQGGYTVLNGPARSTPMTDPRLRRLLPSDVDAVCALDLAVTDEDRSSTIRAIADGWVIDGGQELRGFALRTPWGLGPAIAREPSDGMLLLELLRGQADVEHMTVVVPSENQQAIEHLRAQAFTEQRQLPRMTLGPPPAWQPRAIWTIFSFALG
jgi:GNAT superfamily N-acetyltransferase